MSDYTKINLTEVKDSAPEFGMEKVGEARFARRATGAESIGLAYYKLHPNRRLGFGHSHGDDEEMYLVVEGSGRFKVGDDVFEIAKLDVVYVPPASVREWEAGEDGMTLIAFGGHTEGGAANMDQEFWTA